MRAARRLTSFRHSSTCASSALAPRLVTEGDGKKGKKAKPTAETMSPKFMALKQILLDCGIGEDPLAEKDPDQKQESSGHRVLIFSQLKSLLDLVEDELFGHLLKGVSWLRLDGSVAPTARFDVVRKFIADPSIDVLLLTTHVGGLGLNLTSADTVVFLEHDWNPQKDLQAMDRAHRLGQKRTVNVFPPSDQGDARGEDHGPAAVQTRRRERGGEHR